MAETVQDDENGPQGWTDPYPLKILRALWPAFIQKTFERDQLSGQVLDMIETLQEENHPDHWRSANQRRGFASRRSLCVFASNRIS